MNPLSSIFQFPDPLCSLTKTNIVANMCANCGQDVPLRGRMDTHCKIRQLRISYSKEFFMVQVNTDYAAVILMCMLMRIADIEIFMHWRIEKVHVFETYSTKNITGYTHTPLCCSGKRAGR